MPATLSIQIYSPHSSKKELQFFNADEWTTDSEFQLIQKMHALISMIRPFGKTLHLTLDVEVSDVKEAAFLIEKNANTDCLINTMKLSVREIEIIGLIMQGFTNNEIAEKLFICYETVKSHRKNILFKTGAKNTAALINYYHNTFFEK